MAAWEEQLTRKTCSRHSVKASHCWQVWCGCTRGPSSSAAAASQAFSSAHICKESMETARSSLAADSQCSPQQIEDQSQISECARSKHSARLSHVCSAQPCIGSLRDVSISWSLHLLVSLFLSPSTVNITYFKKHQGKQARFTNTNIPPQGEYHGHPSGLCYLSSEPQRRVLRLDSSSQLHPQLSSALRFDLP